MAKKRGFIFWASRILAILFILFLAVFSFDVFDSCNNFLSCCVGLFIHNLPSIILLVCLIIAWKHELFGAISFVLAGLLYIISVMIRSLFQGYYLLWILQIAGPAFLIGILFFIGWKQKKKNKNGKH
ncbi:MAG: hypothetical protein ABSG05_00400 [Candidatus Pacearchaeota archaeon]|jgi:hypothetical protein